MYMEDIRSLWAGQLPFEIEKIRQRTAIRDTAIWDRPYRVKQIDLAKKLMHKPKIPE